MLIIEGCFCYYTASQPFLLLTPSHQWVGWGCTRIWEGTRLGQLTPTDQRDLPCDTVSCSAYKAGGRRRKGGRTCLKWQRLSSQVTIRCDGALLSWRWLNTCLLMGSSEWIPCFALLVRGAFASPIKLSWSQPTVFFNFTLLILSPIPPEGNERGCRA